MKILGEKIFAKDSEGRLLSRIGTMFLRTSGLVTKKGVHAMQRMMWLDELAKDRGCELSEAEQEAEIGESVDLIFTDDTVLIRPDPDRMDLAFRADEELQKLVSKRRIRYLNTSSRKVRTALTERGENWRMARNPISQQDMIDLIEKSKTAINEESVYYYNHATGTRYTTASGYEAVEKLPPERFRAQVKEVVEALNKRNRMGFPEVDLFPLSTPIEIKQALKSLKVDGLDDAELRKTVDRIDLDWRMSLPAELRDETTSNFEWRNSMCDVITRTPNSTAAEEQELIHGISPEFYRQIEWLPGVRIVDGEVVFDALYEEAARTQNPVLLEMCDSRVKSLIFEMMRLFGEIDYINVGRISRSLARKPVEGNRRGDVYVMQIRLSGCAEATTMMIRMQKWGVSEHLDEGKSLLRSIMEADEYSDYILDRRLMCRQLGMNLPRRLVFGHFTEKYRGRNEYDGVAVRTAYFSRDYVAGIASDKIPAAKYRNPAWVRRFGELMGEAAALDLIVGRRSSTTGELLFDKNYEVVKIGEDGLPREIVITDHAGSFVDYGRELADRVGEYAVFIKDREALAQAEYPLFVSSCLEGFRRGIVRAQQAYRMRRKAFDDLFSDRPYDTNGSGACRWSCALKRLDRCEPEELAEKLKAAVEC
ncbi:MAG: hypothetical protein IKC80_08620 [Kiritimatiellae bacterium]|nr:hypothetical protein [Kiritimatiellia bacterium]